MLKDVLGSVKDVFEYIRDSPISTSTYVHQMMYTFNERINETNYLIKRYPNKIPVIVEKSDRLKIPDISKHKFLFNRNAKFGSIMAKIRKILDVNSSTTVYFSINSDIIPKTYHIMNDIYTKYKDQDQYLYLTYDIKGVNKLNDLNKC